MTGWAFQVKTSGADCSRILNYLLSVKEIRLLNPFQHNRRVSLCARISALCALSGNNAAPLGVTDTEESVRASSLPVSEAVWSCDCAAGVRLNNIAVCACARMCMRVYKCVKVFPY